MDEGYRPIAEDIQRVMPPEILVYDVTPITYRSDEEDNIRAEKVGSLDMATEMGVFTQLRDEYREGWWKHENPTMTLGFSKQHLQGPAGLADMLKPMILEGYELLKQQLSPPVQAKPAPAPKKKRGRPKKTTKA